MGLKVLMKYASLAPMGFSIIDLGAIVGSCQDRFSSMILLEGPGMQGTNEEVSPDTSRC